jgi:hypothetical protein
MLAFRLITTLSLPLVALAVWINAAYASDGTQCHDMPERQAVLEEGKEFLRTHAGETSRNRIRSFDYHYYAKSPFAPEYQFKLPESVEDAQAVPMESRAQIAMALFQADLLEQFLKITAANALYNHLNSGIELNHAADDTQQASILEGVARTTIMLSYVNMDSMQSEFMLAAKQNSLPLPVSVRDTPLLLTARGPILIDATRIAPLNRNELRTLESLYKRAIEIRKNTTDNDSKNLLVSDLLELGALSIRSQNSQDAYEYFSQALTFDPNSTDALAWLLSKKPSVLKYVEKNLNHLLSDKPDTTNGVLLSELIKFYIVSNRPNDAVRVFEDCYEHPLDHRGLLRIGALLALVDVLPEKDINMFTMYLTQNRIDFWLLQQEFSAIMTKLIKRGFSAEADFVCHSIATDSAPRMFVVARWYADSKNGAQLIETTKAILHSIRYDTDEQSLKYLAILNDLLRTSAAQSKNFDAVKSETNKLIAFHEEQIRRKQCLDMAQQLNKTGSDLEKHNHLDMANKLYKQALEIKQANLLPDDPETANQTLELARTSAALRQFVEADRLYEKALATLKKNPKTDPSDTIAALESYGMMLNDWQHEAKAKMIYDEASELYRKTKQK